MVELFLMVIIGLFAYNGIEVNGEGDEESQHTFKL